MALTFYENYGTNMLDVHYTWKLQCSTNTR